MNDQHQVGFAEALRVWIQIALLSFGGPAGQIALINRILVEEKGWISQQRFVHALNYCMILPGPEAMQLVTYTGWLLHGVRGGVVAGILFVIPGFVTILALSFVYIAFQNVPAVEAIFTGIQAAVLAIVVDAMHRMAKKSLQSPSMYALAALAFLAIFAFDLLFPLIILSAALAGLLAGRINKRNLVSDSPDRETPSETSAEQRSSFSLTASLQTALIWLSLWLLPIVLLVIFAGRDNVFTELAIFFAKLALVTFGGAYAVLAYVAQEAVQVYGWLAPGEMLDGLGLAETTPGPLIQVVQFVGYLAGFREAGNMNPMFSATLASVLVTWVTFVPCFLWIFLGAPFIEKLRGSQLLAAALSAVTAAVVGIILNLVIWFALNVLFADLHQFSIWLATVPVPQLDSIRPGVLLITLISLVALLKYRVGIFPVLLGSALAGYILV